MTQIGKTNTPSRQKKQTSSQDYGKIAEYKSATCKFNRSQKVVMELDFFRFRISIYETLAVHISSNALHTLL